MSPGLHHIKSVNSLPCWAKDVRCRRLVDCFPVQQRTSFSAIKEPSEWQSIRIDDPGRLWRTKRGGGDLMTGTLLSGLLGFASYLIDAMGELCLTYHSELRAEH